MISSVFGMVSFLPTISNSFNFQNRSKLCSDDGYHNYLHVPEFLFCLLTMFRFFFSSFSLTWRLSASTTWQISLFKIIKSLLLTWIGWIVWKTKSQRNVLFLTMVSGLCQYIWLASSNQSRLNIFQLILPSHVYFCKPSELNFYIYLYTCIYTITSHSSMHII